MDRCFIVKNMTSDVSRTWAVTVDEDAPVYFHDLREVAEFLKKQYAEGD